MCKQGQQGLSTHNVTTLYWLIPCVLVALDCSKCAVFQGVCRLSGSCLGGVLGCLSDPGYCVGAYDVRAINKHPI